MISQNDVPSSATQTTIQARIRLQKSPFTMALIGLLIVVFAVQELLGGSDNIRSLIVLGANFSPLVNNGEYWRLFTANFLHFGLSHILGNVASLYIFGREVESVFGSPRFIALCILTGLSGQVFSYVFNPGLAVGASTFIFGLIGAFAVYFLRNHSLLGSISRNNLMQLGLVLIINFSTSFQPGSNVDFWGHLGGFIGGLVLGWFFCPRYEPRDTSGGLYLPGMVTTSLELVDTNSLGKQTLVIAAFVLVLIALTLAR